jgi:hypothetical protein
VSNKSWNITPFYVQEVMRWIHLISRNPDIFKQEEFCLTHEQWEPLLKHTSAIIFFAIATQTGPLFESNGTTHGAHDKIGVMEGRSEAYTQHEQKVATELFLALGALPHQITTMLSGSTKNGRMLFNAKKSFVNETKCFAKAMALKYLGMSGKPAWDGRLPKSSRPTSDGGASTKRRKKQQQKHLQETANKKQRVTESDQNPMAATTSKKTKDGEAESV